MRSVMDFDVVGWVLEVKRSGVLRRGFG